MQDAVGGNRVSTCQLCAKEEDENKEWIMWVLCSAPIHSDVLWQRGKTGSSRLSVLSFAISADSKEEKQKGDEDTQSRVS
jgi:hypothetical protein